MAARQMPQLTTGGKIDAAIAIPTKDGTLELHSDTATATPPLGLHLVPCRGSPTTEHGCQVEDETMHAGND